MTQEVGLVKKMIRGKSSWESYHFPKPTNFFKKMK